MNIDNGADKYTVWLNTQYRFLETYTSDSYPDECAIHTMYPEIQVYAFRVPSDWTWDSTDGTGLYLEDCE